ncbi:MAG: ankyrin repeat domain-containing protein [Legionella sp.]|nr:ankyrin repeat domain-containing protein [Legionella sp.]
MMSYTGQFSGIYERACIAEQEGLISKETLKALLDDINQADESNLHTNAQCTTPLYFAAHNGHSSVVKYLLDIAKVNASIRTSKKKGEFSEGLTAFHVAVAQGHHETALVFLERKTIVDRYSLMLAIKYNRTELLRVLLEKVSDPYILKATHHNGSFQDCCYSTLLDYAIDTHPKNKTMIYLLIEKGVPLKRRESFFLRAVRTGDLPLVQRFANNTTDATVFRSALFCAIQFNNLEMTESLLARKNDICNQICNCTDENNKAPIYYAARNGNLDLVKKLIQHGAKTHFVGDSPQNIPLNVALHKGHHHVAKYLIEIKLNEYKAKRQNEAIYKTTFMFFGHTLNFGYSKDEKIAAATALLEQLNDPDMVIDDKHIGALKNGELGDIYQSFLRCNVNCRTGLTPANAP